MSNYLARRLCEAENERRKKQVSEDKITVDELIAMFGDRMPIAAVEILTSGDGTADEKRQQLRELIDPDKTDFYWHRDECEYKFAPLDVCDCVQLNMLDEIKRLRKEVAGNSQHVVSAFDWCR